MSPDSLPYIQTRLDAQESILSKTAAAWIVHAVTAYCTWLQKRCVLCMSKALAAVKGLLVKNKTCLCKWSAYTRPGMREVVLCGRQTSGTHSRAVKLGCRRLE
jgi:hypothetical protein